PVLPYGQGRRLIPSRAPDSPGEQHMAKEGRHSSPTLLAFAAPCLPMAALGLPLVVHLPTYYSQVVGFPLGTVALVFLLVRLLDHRQCARNPAGPAVAGHRRGPRRLPG